MTFASLRFPLVVVLARMPLPCLENFVMFALGSLEPFFVTYCETAFAHYFVGVDSLALSEARIARYLLEPLRSLAICGNRFAPFGCARFALNDICEARFEGACFAH